MSKVLLVLVPVTLVLLGLPGCGGAAEKPDMPGDTPSVKPATEKPAKPELPPSALLDPKGEAVNRTAPDTFQAKLETTKGDIVIEVHRDWAPKGADRFYNLVANGYYDGCRFFRVISGFMAQFGMHGDPKVNAVWSRAEFDDDPVRKSNVRGTVTFATSGPNSRTTQLFINFRDNSGNLDSKGFAPFGLVLGEGMKVVDSLYSGYGEGSPRGKGPDQRVIAREGNAYLEKSFPKLDWIKKATILK